MFLPVAILCFGWILSICVYECGYAIGIYWGKGNTSARENGYSILHSLQSVGLLPTFLLPLVFLLIAGIPFPSSRWDSDLSNFKGKFWHAIAIGTGSLLSLLFASLLALPFWFHWIASDASSPFVVALACLSCFNFSLAVLNWLPIYPLNGSHLVEPWLPTTIRTLWRNLGWLSLMALLILLKTVPELSWSSLQPGFKISEWLHLPTDLAQKGYDQLHNEPPTQRIVATLILGITYLIIRLLRAPYHLLDVLGFGLLLCHQPEKALACFDQVIQAQPGNYAAWLNRGNALSCLEQYEAAIASYDVAIQLKPDYYSPFLQQGTHQAWLNRGNALQKLQRYQEALVSYEQATALRPKDPVLWYNKGVALHNWGWNGALVRLTEALTAYNQAIHLKPDYYQAWFNQGVILSQVGQWKEALTAFDNALKINPRFAPAWLNRGIVLSALERSQEAEESFERAKQLLAR